MARTEVREKRKMKKGLVIALSILLALAVIAAVIVLSVYRGMNIFLKAELGDGAPEASAFMKGKVSASYAKEPDISLKEEGTYMLTVKTDDGNRKVLLIVRDTKAPEAEAANPDITIDDKSLKPAEALTKISDASEYTVSWKTEPTYGTAGSYDCEVVLKDSHGNSRTVKTTVNVLGLKDVLEYEAGTPHPTLDDFMVVERENAELVTDMSKIDWAKLGDNKIEAKFDGKTYSSILRIVDTTAPVPDVVPVAVLADAELNVADFVLGCDDATEVTYDFAEEPSTAEKGSFDCVIKATDKGENTAEANTKLFVCDALAEFEASTDMLSESEVLKQIGSEYADYKMKTEAFMLNSLGAHEVEFTKGEDTITVGVTVKDTTAPTADGINCPCSTGYYCEPIKFVENIVDVSAVKASFAEEPDWSTEGEQEVEIVLTDRAGNSTTVKATAVITPDTTAPVIYGVRDYYFYVGEDVANFKEVFAEDNADPDVELTVDKSKVDAGKAGEYEVTYTAKDHEGNENTATVKFTFIEKTVSDEKLNAAIDSVLDEIIDENMTTEQKAYAIFDYVYTKISISGKSDKTDWKAEAYRGLTEGKGDDFTCYAVSYALLQRIDCRVISVEGQGSHIWCFVNLGNGWYNFDACSNAPKDTRCFMKTSDELKNISSSYWSYKTAQYPAPATIPYAMKNA